MNQSRKGHFNTDNRVLESKKKSGYRTNGDKDRKQSSPLEFNPNADYVTEEIAFDYLASILAEIYIHQIQCSKQTKKQ